MEITLDSYWPFSLDDDLVLATALAAETQLIVSGDRDLLDLGTFRDLRILTATQALATLGR